MSWAEPLGWTTLCELNFPIPSLLVFFLATGSFEDLPGGFILMGGGDNSIFERKG